MEWGFWVLPIFVLLFVGVAVLATLQERKRRDALRLMADQLNLSFDPDGGEALTREFARFHLFQRGDNRRARYFMHGGTGDREVLLFDHEFGVGSGKNRHVQKQTVVVFPLGRATVPEFEVRPENIFHKIGGLFGYQDIDFPERPEFSSRYLVRGKDETAVRALLNGRRIDALESAAAICVEGGGAWLVVYRDGTRVKPADIPSFLDEARGIRDAFARQ